MRRILENRIAGIKTNKTVWQFFYPGDESMNRVDAISNTYFDFGGKPSTGSVSTPGGGSPTVDPVDETQLN